MAKREEFYYDSRDGQSKIYAVKWVPEKEPVCVLQIIHGMSEHIQRYDDFAFFLTKYGILVVAEDHLGHGRSVKDGEIYGYFCKQDPATVVVRDVHRLKKMIQEEYKGIPYFILGHSMGSFILRNYLFRYGTGIKGALVMGTGDQPKAALYMGKILAAMLSVVQGNKRPSYLLQKIALGNNNERFKEEQDESAWLSKEKSIIKQYKEDEKCGFAFTINGYKTLFEIINRAKNYEKMKKLPTDLSLCILSGMEDPVGHYGKDPKWLYDCYKEMGIKDLSLMLYEGDRHEILNEVDREKVYQDILNWIKGRLKKEN